MAKATVPPLGEEKPLIAASMFGVTTAGVTVARERLEELGYEVLVFHQTGAGGGSMEALIGAGFIAGSLDVTTTEFCDLVAGGVLVAVPGAARVGREARASRRSSRWARSTWSTSAPSRRCRSAIATGTSTSTTRRSR